MTEISVERSPPIICLMRDVSSRRDYDLSRCDWQRHRRARLIFFIIIQHSFSSCCIKRLSLSSDEKTFNEYRNEPNIAMTHWQLYSNAINSTQAMSWRAKKLYDCDGKSSGASAIFLFLSIISSHGLKLLNFIRLFRSFAVHVIAVFVYIFSWNLEKSYFYLVSQFLLIDAVL